MMGEKKKMKWTKERVLQESKKYITRTEFAHGSPGAFHAAWKKGWLSEMVWHIPQVRNWTREAVFEESRKYTSRTEFARKCVGAYMAAKRNGWLDEMTWLPLKVHIKWTKEDCFAESKKYTTRNEFQRNASGAYTAAVDNGWLDEMTWLTLMHRKKWTKDECIEESKKYSSKIEFQQNSAGAYQAALQNKWLVEMTWLRTPVLKEIKQVRKHLVYVYIDEENMACYIGRTTNLKRRDREHRNLNGKYRTDSLKEYFDKLLADIPQPIILKDKLLPAESQYWEHYFVQEYAALGYFIINRGKTGVNIGSLGGGFIKWTKEKTLEESKKYRTFGEFGLGNASAYQAARKNNWVEEMTWLTYDQMPNDYWTKERVIEESKKYSSRVEFEEKCPAGYSAALKKGWSKDLPLPYQRVPNQFYSREQVFAESRKYRSRSEFKQKCSRGYVIARQNHWLDEMPWLKPLMHSWTKETIIEESKKYTSRGAFEKGNGSAYGIALKNGWLDEMTWLIPKRRKWTKEAVFEESKKYTSTTQFIKHAHRAYEKARNNGWLAEMSWLQSSS